MVQVGFKRRYGLGVMDTVRIYGLGVMKIRIRNNGYEGKKQ